MEHGEVDHQTKRRWCAGCDQYHGGLYDCPNFPDWLRDSIRAERETWKGYLENPDWLREQVDAGVPLQDLRTHQALMDMEPVWPRGMKP